MKLKKQTVSYLLLLPLIAVALYAFFVKCDLLFLFGFQIVWLIAATILYRKSN